MYNFINIYIQDAMFIFLINNFDNFKLDKNVRIKHYECSLSFIFYIA